MSITVTSKHDSEPQPQDTIESPQIDDPREWFLDEIIHDPRVCSNCLGLVQQIEPVVDEDIPLDETRDRLPTATLDQDLVAPPAEIATSVPLARPRTTCLECGSIGCLASDEALSRREVLERVPALAARLQERDYDIDERVLREAVRVAHAKGPLAGDTARLFGTAAKVAINHS